MGEEWVRNGSYLIGFVTNAANIEDNPILGVGVGHEVGVIC